MKQDKSSHIKGKNNPTVSAGETVGNKSGFAFSETLFRSVFDATGVGIYITNQQARIEDVNETLAQMYGYSRSELIGQSVTIFATQNGQGDVLKAHEAFFANGKEYESKHKTRRKDGFLLTVNISCRLIKHADGEAYQVSTVREISEELKQEEQLHKAMFDLRERLKEQQCLYDIASLEVLNQPEGKIFEQAARIIRRSLIYSKSAKLCFNYKNRDYQYPDSILKTQKNEISYRAVASTKQSYSLLIELCYSLRKDGFNHPEIAPEEKKLLDAVANMLSLKLSRREIMLERKQAIGELQKIFDYSIDVICSFDQEHRFVKASAASERLWGYPSKELEGMLFLDLVAEEDKKRTELAREKVRQGNNLSDFVNRMIHKNGSVKIVQWSVYANPEEPYVYAVAKDITDKNKAEEMLALSERRFRSLIQEGVEMICIVNTKGVYEYVSPSYEQILGEKPEDLVGSNGFTLIHEDDRNELQKQFNELVEGKKIKTAPYRVRHKQGHYIWMQSTGTNLIDDPAVGGFVINSIDISDIQQARHELQENARKLLRANQISKIGYWQLDFETNSLYWSDEVYEMWGLNREDFQPGFKSFISTIHPDDRVVFEKRENFSLAEDESVDWDHRIILPDGSVKWVQERAETTIDENGKFVLEGTVQDITLKKNEELRLRLMETVATSTGDGILVCTQKNAQTLNGLQIEFANNAYCRVSKFAENEVKGQLISFKLSPNGNHKGLQKLDTAVKAGQKAEETILLLNKKGEEYWANISISPVKFERGGELYWIVTHREVTLTKERELRERFHADISKQFNEHSDLKGTIKEMLRYLIIWSDFQLAECWLVSADKQRINHVGSYYVEGDFAEYVSETREIGSLQIGIGLPGLVLKTGRSALWENVHKKKLFVRHKAAEKAGLRTVFALPFLNAGEVVGVLLFSSTNSNKKLNFYDQVMRELKSYLGREIKRKQLEEELNSIFNVASDIICIANFDGYYERINPAATKLTGYTEEELLSRPLLDFLHPEDRKKSADNLDGLKSGAWVDYFENRFITKNGDIVWLAWTSSSIPKEGRIYAIAKNITETKKLERMLDTTTAISRIGGWEANLETGELKWTDMMRELYEADENFKPDMDIGYGIFREGESREHMEKLIKRAIDEHVSVDEEVEMLTAKNNLRWIRFLAEPVLTGDRCVRLQGSIQDITTRKAAELAAAEKSKFLRAVATTIETFLKYDDWHKVLQESFESLAKTLRADRMFLFEHVIIPENGKSAVKHAFEWHGEGIDSLRKMPELQLVPYENFPDSFEVMLRGETHIIYTNKLTDGPEKSLLTSLGIYSQLLVPIFIKKTFIGFVGVDNCSSVRPWTDDEKSFMQTFVKNMAAAYQRKEQLLAIKRSDEEKNTILENIGDGFFTTSGDLDEVIYWNRVAEQTVGIRRSEVVGHQIWKVLENNGNSELRKSFKQAKEQQKPVHLETYYEPLGIWIDASIYPAGLNTAVYFRNIDDRKYAEQTLRESNERFEKATQATNDAIWDWRMDSNELWWGEGFKTLFGYEGGLVGGNMAFRSKVHPDDLEKLNRVIQSAIDNPDIEFISEELRFKKADGSYAYITDRAQVIRNEKGEMVRLIGAISDITQRKKYEESLKELNQTLDTRARELAVSNEELEQFAYVASHDLQEPLRMVSSFLTQLERKYGHNLDERARTYIHYAVDGSKRMRQIILDLLEYSRVGKKEDEIELLDLNEVVGEVLILSNRLIIEKKAEITVEVLPEVYSRKSPLIQVFHNLIGNALKYNRPGMRPEISVRYHADHPKDEWLFSVSDNGLGINPEFYEKIFIIFQRLHTKDEYAGTGMGLAIVKKIIETMGGRIWVESIEDGGTTFYFTIKKLNQVG